MMMTWTRGLRVTTCFPWRFVAIWFASSALACMAGSLLALSVLPDVNWGAAGAGWGIALLNSFAGHLINRRAVGRSGKTFIVWGLAANAFRLLTVLVIFAYIVVCFPSERASFLVMAFVAFFVMMGGRSRVFSGRSIRSG